MNGQLTHKWWSTLKSAVFGSSSLFLPLVSDCGGPVYESVGKADLLAEHFDSKQSREAVDLPPTCHPSTSLTTCSFRSIEVRRLLLHLDPYGRTDPLRMFPFFVTELLMMWPPS